MLSIIRTLKKSYYLLGYKIEAHTDHKNLGHETTLMTSDCLMLQRIILEEYVPDMHYIPAPENIVADT